MFDFENNVVGFFFHSTHPGVSVQNEQIPVRRLGQIDPRRIHRRRRQGENGGGLQQEADDGVAVHRRRPGVQRQDRRLENQ